MKQLLVIFVFITTVEACNNPSDSVYQNSILLWQKERLANLIKEDGWATLAGLFSLRDGIQYFGSSQALTIHFPDFAPDTIGTFTVNSDSVWMETQPSVQVMTNGAAQSRVLLTPATDLQICTWQRLQWFVIQRGTRFLIRLRDTQHPARQQLTEIPYYPIDKKWDLSATFHHHDTPTHLQLPNALGMMIDYESPGYLTFSYEGKDYQMLALQEEDELFLLFYDETSGTETYGGGRYMYVDKPAPGEMTELDFNKAYSPPCAFTEFATCLLPPPENRFPFAITAGEKDPHFLEHQQ
ncbi:MAG: DUF1684 domain-containing protein [Saprospiraceae bacterium]|nr:DUF1684 domain-containing protein [Saprospiraceae bacterium]